MTIILSNGARCLVDESDSQSVQRFNWYQDGHGYAHTQSNYKFIKMHRLITGAKPGEEVDHVNGNRLDNRRANLRICSRTENARAFQKKRIGTSTYRGVSFCRPTGRWRAQITVNKKSINLGRYFSDADAALAYNTAALEFFGEFAVLNEVSDV
jgi:hypothetical protein